MDLIKAHFLSQFSSDGQFMPNHLTSTLVHINFDQKDYTFSIETRSTCQKNQRQTTESCMFYMIQLISVLIFITFNHVSVAKASGIYSTEKVACASDGKCVYPDDGIPWKFQTSPQQTVLAIGDLHGDLHSLHSILDYYGITPHEEHPQTRPSHVLVQVGDIVDRGPDSKKILDYFMTHDSVAKSSHGILKSQTITLLGNHEVDLLKGRLYGLSGKDIAGFRAAHIARMKGGDSELSDEEILVQTFLRPGPYANWIARQNAIIQVDQKFYVHASLPKDLIRFSPAEINSTIRKWLQYRIGAGPRPDSRTEWVFGIEGPFNNVKMQLGADQDYLDELFRMYQVNQVVVGHIPYARGGDIVHHVDEIKTQEKVLRIDTGINLTKYDLGFVAAFEIKRYATRVQLIANPMVGACKKVL